MLARLALRMPAQKISKDTSRFFGANGASQQPTRRITRASLAKFAYGADAETKAAIKSTLDEEGEGDLRLGSDIEDAITRTSRKRRRVTTRDGDAAMEVETTTTGTTTTLSSPPNEPATPKAPRRARKPARKVQDPETGETTVSPPSDWEEMYNTVLAMRQPGGVASNAAVDTMGCERLADRKASPRDQRFHTLVSLMLSSQTKDTVNAVVMAKLQKELPPYKEGASPGLNLENMLAVEPALLNEFIWAVGFHNNKTKYLKQVAEILRDKWNGDIPDTIEGLVSLPGVGPKMAHLCMSVAWGRTEGIGVDVHVHRITNLWGWNKTRNPEETRLALQSWLPRDKWHQINWLLVGFGQTVCLPVGRKCGQCDLGLDGLCKAADRAKVAEGKRARARARMDVKVEKVEAKIKIDEGDEDAKGIKLDVAVKEEEDEKGEGINGAMAHHVKVEASDDDVKESLASLQDVKPVAISSTAAVGEQPTEGKRSTRARRR
ncbi:hypothetical protein jhhlp_006291 [Lomentospora prolificans]|uniref:Endonuclease III homolog n=1 Tax=Lomentospora prolificans TaxID=41688 RepID=A0A2N3N5G0_9PEZI|nr:hypothetical protein jhhlp_006291 [Lomentospora prolificans]